MRQISLTLLLGMTLNTGLNAQDAPAPAAVARVAPITNEGLLEAA